MASTYGNTKLNICNECDERPVEMMVGKAMCAWANARETFKIPHTDPRFDAVSQDEIVAMLESARENVTSVQELRWIEELEQELQAQPGR